LQLVATGSEVALAMSAAAALDSQGVPVRVISAPCWERFEQLPASDREAVVLPGVPVITVEAGLTLGWRHVAGTTGACIGIDRFGASAPDKVLAEKFGFTVSNVVRVALDVLSRG
jgi:transketolase